MVPPVGFGGQAFSSDLDDFSSGLGAAEDGGSSVGFFELDEELKSPRKGEVQRFDFDDADPFGGQLSTNAGGRKGRNYSEDSDAESTGFKSGSVPIDIIRPTGSWVGSFGH